MSETTITITFDGLSEDEAKRLGHAVVDAAGAAAERFGVRGRTATVRNFDGVNQRTVATYERLPNGE